MTPPSDIKAIVERLRKAMSRSNDDICQTLGKALGYPWFKDDAVNFPDATEENGVCIGDHVAESIAAEAADKLTGASDRLALVDAVKGISDDYMTSERHHPGYVLIPVTKFEQLREVEAGLSTTPADVMKEIGK